MRVCVYYISATKIQKINDIAQFFLLFAHKSCQNGHQLAEIIVFRGSSNPKEYYGE